MFNFTQRWTEDWSRLDLAGDSVCLDRLLASHAGPGRHYHTLQHLAECLTLFAEVARMADHPGELAIALWFHDAIYLPRAPDNEARSAAWAAEALRVAGAGEAAIARVEALIMATAGHDAHDSQDTRLVIDIDLAILGAPPARFAQYEQQVRAEYAAVPLDIYRQKRGELLASFLARPEIYVTPALHTRLEAQARINLRDAIAGSNAKEKPCSS